jgi:MerR family transcriptional regulator, light-induced transcriptional regulator
MANLRRIKIKANRSNDFEQSRSHYSASLTAGDAEAADHVIDELLAQQCSLVEIYTQIIGPSLASIGDLWCRGDIGVAAEHLATQIVSSHLDRVGSIFAWRERRSSYRVLVACVEGERHYIGARMFADLCRSHGWSVDFLGADVPDDALVDWVDKNRPQLVALSATMAEGIAHARSLVGGFTSLTAPPPVILGGQALSDDALKNAIKGHGQIARDVLDGIAVAQKFLRANRPKVILKEYLLALGRRVRDLRLKKAWTQEQLAEATRVTRVCIVAVEGGKQNVSMDIVVRLANALGVTPESLLAGDGETLQVFGRNG